MRDCLQNDSEHSSVQRKNSCSPDQPVASRCKRFVRTLDHRNRGFFRFVTVATKLVCDRLEPPSIASCLKAENEPNQKLRLLDSMARSLHMEHPYWQNPLAHRPIPKRQPSRKNKSIKPKSEPHSDLPRAFRSYRRRCVNREPIQSHNLG